MGSEGLDLLRDDEVQAEPTPCFSPLSCLSAGVCSGAELCRVGFRQQLQPDGCNSQCHCQQPAGGPSHHQQHPIDQRWQPAFIHQHHRQQLQVRCWQALGQLECMLAGSPQHGLYADLHDPHNYYQSICACQTHKRRVTRILPFRNGYAVAITLSSQPAGTVTVTVTVDDASGGGTSAPQRHGPIAFFSPVWRPTAHAARAELQSART